MHVIAAIGFISGLMWFAFGLGAARAFVGAILVLGALAVLILVGIAATDIHRQSVHPIYQDARR